MTRFRSVGLGSLLVAVMATSWIPTASAQAYRPAAANEVTEFKGTLKGVRGNIVSVEREDGVECIVMFPDEITGVEFVADALPAYLRRGTLVRFATTLGPTGMPMTPVDKLEVIAPVNVKGLNAHSRTKLMPGVNSAERKPMPKNGVLSGKVYVVGNLMMLAPNGGLAVQAGKYPVQTMVKPDAKFEIRANNLSLAQVGDAISVSGFYQPPDDTKVKAERIIVTTDRVYGEAPPAKTRKPKRGSKKKPDETLSEPEGIATKADGIAEGLEANADESE